MRTALELVVTLVDNLALRWREWRQAPVDAVYVLDYFSTPKQVRDLFDQGQP